MPEIDVDLFQVLALALLLLCLLCLVAVLSILSSIKKELGNATVGSAPAETTSGYGYEAPAATPAYQPAAYTPAQTQTQPTEASTDFVPLSEATSPTAAATTTSSPGLRGDEPEEQPFERDGRWWFKRGSELLVYDEGTGQWVASGAGAGAVAPSLAPSSTATQTIGGADAGEGWKCSSCGAVNGSTATSCRMCFAPR